MTDYETTRAAVLAIEADLIFAGEEVAARPANLAPMLAAKKKHRLALAAFEREVRWQERWAATEACSHWSEDEHPFCPHHIRLRELEAADD